MTRGARDTFTSLPPAVILARLARRYLDDVAAADQAHTDELNAMRQREQHILTDAFGPDHDQLPDVHVTDARDAWAQLLAAHTADDQQQVTAILATCLAHPDQLMPAAEEFHAEHGGRVHGLMLAVLAIRDARHDLQPATVPRPHSFDGYDDAGLAELARDVEPAPRWWP